jgi:hypothetical protein
VSTRQVIEAKHIIAPWDNGLAEWTLAQLFVFINELSDNCGIRGCARKYPRNRQRWPHHGYIQFASEYKYKSDSAVHKGFWIRIIQAFETSAHLPGSAK